MRPGLQRLRQPGDQKALRHAARPAERNVLHAVDTVSELVVFEALDRLRQRKEPGYSLSPSLSFSAVNTRVKGSTSGAK